MEIISIPFRLPVEKSARGVNEDNLAVHQRPVSLLRVFLGRIPEEARADGFLHVDSGFAARNHIQFMPKRDNLLELFQSLECMNLPVHDSKKLLPHVLGSFQCPDLDEILVAPRVREFVCLPRVVDGQQSDVVSLDLVEFGFFLVGNRLFVFRTEK
jgi:hypothetical protein